MIGRFIEAWVYLCWAPYNFDLWIQRFLCFYHFYISVMWNREHTRGEVVRAVKYIVFKQIPVNVCYVWVWMQCSHQLHYIVDTPSPTNRPVLECFEIPLVWSIMCTICDVMFWYYLVVARDLTSKLCGSTVASQKWCLLVLPMCTMTKVYIAPQGSV